MWLSITQVSRRHPNAFISKHSFSVHRVLLKRKDIKGRSRPGISKDNNRVFKHAYLFLHTALLFSFKVNYVCLFFSLNYKRKQWPSSENFFISNILYPSCYCSLPFWGLGMTMGNLATSHPPISLENGFGSQPDCIVILLSITNVPDTQSIGEEVQWLERTPEDMANVISDLPGDL